MRSSQKLHVAAVAACLSAGAVWGALQDLGERDVKKLAKVEVVASSDTVVPGKPMTVAVKFTMAPHWHIYWHNPGDSGMATALSLKAPAGWTVGQWRFPLPKKFEQTGGLVGYGYEKEAVFLVDVTPPANFTGEASLDAEAVFLICEDVCLPGNEKKTLKVTAGVAAEPTPAWMVEWGSKVPLKFDGEVKATGAISSAWSPFAVTLGDVSKEWSGVEIFPLASDEIELRNIQAAVGSGGAGSATINFEAKKYGQEIGVPTSITLLAVFTTVEGRRVGRWIDVPSGAPAIASPSTLPSTGVPSK